MHVNKIRSKLSSVCGVLFRLRNKLTKSVSKLIYSSLAYSYLNYCNLLWSSCCKSIADPIFVTQKKIIRIICRKRRSHPSTPLFKSLKLLKLKDINDLHALIFVYKTVNGLIPSTINFTSREAGPYNLRRVEPLVVPFTHTNQSKRFIHIRGANLWNELDANIRSCRTVATFKKQIKIKFLEQY